MKTLPEILDDHNTKVKQASKRYDGYPVSKGKRELKQAIAKELMGCLPEKRELFEPVTKRPVTGVGDKVGIDLEADTKGSLKFIQDNGFNMALAEVRARLTAFIGEVEK